MEHAAKTCEHCHQPFFPAYRVTKAYWATRRFCSVSCHVEGMRGKPLGPRKGPTREQLIARFWSKVLNAGEAECWPWTGAKNLSGYGFMSLQRSPQRWLSAHRFSYEIASGKPVPPTVIGKDGVEGKTQVCHSCDKPLCMNPAHLWLGTLADNQKDKMQKGRDSDKHGEKNPRAKLTEGDVSAIKRLRAEGLSQQLIAGRYGVSQVTISGILSGRLWSHLAQRVEI